MLMTGEANPSQAPPSIAVLSAYIATTNPGLREPLGLA